MYTIREAAWMLQQSEAKLRRWLFAAGEAQFLHGMKAGRACFIEFPVLIEALVVGQLRAAGFPMQQIRRARTAFAKRTQAEYPFAHETLRIDCNNKKLYWLADGSLTDLESQQMAFLKVIGPYLDALEFDPATHMATRWAIGRGVVVDPNVGYGGPVIAGTRVSADLVAAMFKRTGDAAATAEWYDITPDQVHAASDLMTRLAAKRQMAA